MIKRMLVVAATFITAIVAASSAFAEDKVTLCHAAGLDGTTHYVTITVGYPAAFGHAGHFHENGTPQAGHEDDYLGECVVHPPPPVDPPDHPEPPVHPPTDPPVTPPTQGCVPTGAGKDGHVPANGNTNDDCLPLDSPPVVTQTPISASVTPPAAVVVSAPVTKPVVKIKPKKVVKAKAKPKKVKKTVKLAPKPDKPVVCKKGFRYTPKYGCTAAVMGSG